MLNAEQSKRFHVRGDRRKAIADHIGPARGINVDPDQIVIVAGCQAGLNLTARLLLRGEVGWTITQASSSADRTARTGAQIVGFLWRY